MVWSYYSNIAMGSAVTAGASGHVVDTDEDYYPSVSQNDHSLVRVTQKNGRSYVARQDSYDGTLHHEDEMGYRMTGDTTGNWFSSWQNMMAFKNPAMEAAYKATSEKSQKFAAMSRRRSKRKKAKQEFKYKNINTQKEKAEGKPEDINMDDDGDVVVVTTNTSAVEK